MSKADAESHYFLQESLFFPHLYLPFSVFSGMLLYRIEAEG